MTNNYSYTNISLLTDAIIKEVTTKAGKKVLALTAKAKTDAGTVIDFTQFASAQPANELQAQERASLINRAPYLHSGRKVTVKTKAEEAIKKTVIAEKNTTYLTMTGWIQNMDANTLDMKRAEERKGMFRV